MTTRVAVSLDAAMRLLSREARLLDERRFADWLALYSEDASYWIPARQAGREFTPDNSSALSLLRMDRALLADWVTRMNSGHAHAEPVGATRLVGGVEADEVEPGVFHAAWMLQVCAHGKSDVYSGRSRVVLAPLPDGSLRILRKEVRILQESIASGYLPIV